MILVMQMWIGSEWNRLSNESGVHSRESWEIVDTDSMVWAGQRILIYNSSLRTSAVFALPNN